jgi:uncharacterized membrane protein
MIEIYVVIGLFCLAMDLFIFKTQEPPKMVTVIIFWPLFILWIIMKPFTEREQRRIMSQTVFTFNTRRIIRAERDRQRKSKIETQKPVVKEVVPVGVSTRMEAVIQDLDN